MPVKLASSTIPHTLEQLDAILLKNRNISDPKTFFHPLHPSMLDEVDTGLSKTVLDQVAQRLHQAKEQHESVVIFGDYDADGVCATAILWEALFSLGVRALPFIPDRFNHGYGLTVAAIKALMAQSRPDLIITVDNGIVAYDALNMAKREGIFTIVTDHHQPDKQPLPADMIVHSTKLCGSGVAWMLAHHLAPTVANRSLELAGLATIADQVPLVGANRSMAVHGLEALRQTKRIGLLELFAVAGVEQKKITEKTVGFAIAPRINAMGRLASALDALRLLCTTSTVRAHNLAQLLQDKNSERQQLTTDFVTVAKKQAETQAEAALIIVHDHSFHEGVIGLIAGRLVEEYHKPVIVIAMGETIGKGSARSIPQLNMVGLLRSVREHLLELGGHPMAAGFNVGREQLSQFIEAAQKQAVLELADQPTEVEHAVECQLPAELVTLETAQHLERSFAPFGIANPQPMFAISNLTCLDTRLVGKQANHRKYTFALDKTMISGMAWYQPKPLIAPNTEHLTVIAALGIEEWKKVSLLLSVVHIE